MAKSIRIHPKFGVNPTLGVCFWCEKPDGTIAMLGAAIRHEAPMHSVVSYEPCETCKAGMALGIVCIEVDRAGYPDRPPLKKSEPESVPTGRWVVLKREAAERMAGPDGWPEIERAGRVLIPTAAWRKMGFPTADAKD